MERQTSPKKKGALRQAFDAYLFLSGIGIFFCVVLGICMYAGSLADEAFALGHKGIFAGILGIPACHLFRLSARAPYALTMLQAVFTQRMKGYRNKKIFRKT